MSGWYPNQGDLSSIDNLERTFKLILDTLYRVPLQIDQSSKSLESKIPGIIKSSLPLINTALQATGANPLNVTNLIGASTTIIIDTHANKVNYIPSVGSLLEEQDRHVLYVGELVSGTATWVYAAGIYEDVIANRPTDLGVNDIGFRFYANDSTQKTVYIWTGTLWITVGGLLQIVSDAVTNVVSTIHELIHLTSGTAAAGFGARLLTQLQNAGGSQVDGSALDVVWTTATAGSESSDLIISVRKAGAALAEAFRLIGATTQTKISDLLMSSGIIQPTADSTTAIRIKNAAGSATIIDVDATNKRVGVGTAAPGAFLHVLGAGGSLSFLRVEDSAPNTDIIVDVIGSGIGAGTYFIRCHDGATDYFYVKGDGTVLSSATIAANTGYKQNGTETTATNFLASDGTNFVGRAIANADLPNAAAAHTITLAKITAGGANGSITWNSKGIITAFVDPT